MRKPTERTIRYQVNDWKPQEFIATKGQTDAEILAFLQGKHRNCTITILSNA